MRRRAVLFLPIFAFVSFMAHEVSASTLNFATPASYGPGGNGPNGVVVADLNGDGKLDVIVSDWCVSNSIPCPNGAVGVLLGNGNGTLRPAVTYNSGGIYATGLAVGDLNGDGKPDIVVVNCGNASGNQCIGAGGNAGVLFGNGDGTFRPVVTITLGGGGFGAIAAAIADVNNDGNNDIIVAGDCLNGGCGGVLLGNGDGTFGSEITFDSGGLIAFSLAVGDVNGDGNLDAVIGNQCAQTPCNSSTVGVALGNGDGTFQTPTTYDSGGIYPDGVAIADLGNGNADIVVANSSTSTTVNQGDVGVLINNGNGTFQPVASYPASLFGAAAIRVADMDGDGKLDVVVVNCSATSGSCQGGNGDVGVLLGNGDGTLQPVKTFPPGGSAPYGLAVGDLNGDSKPDIVTGNCIGASCGQAPGTVGVLLNTSHGDSATQLTSSPNPSGFGQAVTFTATVSSASFKVTPTGNVTFFDGGTNIGSGSLNSHAVATLTTTTLSVGTHNVKATYNGDANYVASTSTAVAQQVQGPIVQLSPTSLNFGNQTIGTTSAPKTVTLTNTGLGVLKITAATITGPFAIAATNCTTTLNPGSNCTANVTFKPTKTGPASGALSLTDNAPQSPQKVTLSGTGTSAQLAPTSLNFGNQAVGTTSARKLITLTNKGSVALNISRITITGANAGEFNQANNCGASIGAGASCSIGVNFTPSATGSRSASISVSDDGGGSPHNAALVGTGT
jgi:hypothetical protein